ncbi:MAG TPA: GH116 family glycosyl-hydrolase, partial [Candidatus Acidoferrales bacterium]|nr:GH116 family glycosyl-hydrolase [Candidatus Acidoferrales bacterium]
MPTPVLQKESTPMRLSRRRFLATCAATGTAALADSTSLAAPYRVTVQNDGTASRSAAGSAGDAAPLRIPAAMPMGSGAPLGGIGTGFVEIRADGCFYEWQIFNSGPWAMNARSTTAPPPPGPQYLQFLLRAKKDSQNVGQIRRLYLRSDENNLYSLPFVQDVQSIEYRAAYPITGLRYNDSAIPVRISAIAFSPFIPGNARESATPGFHVVYALENPGDEPVEVSLLGLFDNPL